MLKLELLDLDDMGIEPLAKTTIDIVDEAKVELLPALGAHMMNMKLFPRPLPYLHCRQVGAMIDMAVWRRPNKPTALVINPTFVVLDKSYNSIGTEVCASYKYPKSDVFKVFASERATKILGKFDSIVDGRLVPDSEEFLGDDAVAFQQMCDISAGKLISRFEAIDTKKKKKAKKITQKMITKAGAYFNGSCPFFPTGGECSMMSIVECNRCVENIKE